MRSSPSSTANELSADVGTCTQDRVSETLRLALPDEMDVGEVARLHHSLESPRVALLHEPHLELGHRVEVVGDRVLVAADDDEDVVDPGVRSLFDDVLDRRLVDDGQHLFRHRLRRGKESSPSPAAGMTA